MAPLLILRRDSATCCDTSRRVAPSHGRRLERDNVTSPPMGASRMSRPLAWAEAPTRDELSNPPFFVTSFHFAAEVRA